MKKRKRAIYIVFGVIAIPLLLFITSGLYLSNSSINGFNGILGIISLSDTKVYVELTDDPMQLLIRQSDAKGDFENSYFDNWEDTGHPGIGFGEKNNQKYEYSFRSFTRKYFIVTLKRAE